MIKGTSFCNADQTMGNGGSLGARWSWAKALKMPRELTEETGMIAGELQSLDVYSGADFFITYANGDQAYVVGATFLAESASGEPTPDEDETLELRYFPKGELPETLNAYNFRLLERCRGKF